MELRNPVAELQRAAPNMERRVFPLEEVRIEPDGPRIVGYAAVFNAQSEDLGGFREVVAPGAFRKTLREGDVRALINHDSNLVLGRTKSKTLTLKEDERGLAIDILVPDTSYARDLMEVMRRGDVDQMSFAFRVVKDTWDNNDSPPTRTLREVQLFDVSPVTFPAYPATVAQVRSLLDALRDTDIDALSPEEIRDIIAELERRIPTEPRLEPHSDRALTEPPVDRHSGRRHRELALLAQTL